MHTPNLNPLPKINIVKADSEKLRSQAFLIRKEVFVDEQKVSSEEEFDQFENASHHFVALDENNKPVGAARWRTTNKGVKLERFAVKKSFRGQHIGSALVEAVLQDIQKELGKGQHLYMHSQVTAMPLYLKFGFKQIGDQFEECDIMHYMMELDV